MDIFTLINISHSKNIIRLDSASSVHEGFPILTEAT